MKDQENKMLEDRVLFIGDTSRWSQLASACLKGVFSEVDTIFWDYGRSRTALSDNWEGDRIFTFKADLILGADLIARAHKTAINFHPSIPDFRGVGGYNYAISEGRTCFGVMCHHLTERIDFGEIIRVNRFPGRDSFQFTRTHSLLLLILVLRNHSRDRLWRHLTRRRGRGLG